MLDLAHSEILAHATAHPVLSLGFATVGVIVISSHVFSFLKLIGQFAFPWVSGKSLKSLGAGKGAWAVVTGPTGDIGKCYADQLAKSGFNIVLVGRSEEKLKEVASGLESKYKIKSEIVILDFNGADKSSGLEKIKELASTHEINVLVNNAGASHAFPVMFHETEVDVLESIIEVNLRSTLLITQLLIPGMISRRKGAILTLGSFSAVVPAAMLATYAGSKGFLDVWSQALATELKEFGIVVELTSPYFVVSAMSKIRKPTLLIPLPKDFVKASLSSIGLSGGARYRPYNSTPYWTHGIFDWVLSTAGVKKFAMNQGLAMHKDIRRRALRKQERLAKQQ